MSRFDVPVRLITVLTLGLLGLGATSIQAQQADDPAGDPERGRVVFRSVGHCVDCHGWAGDASGGTRLQAPIGPNLRQTGLDTAELMEVVGCGRPGTPMPYHDRTAYRDGHCLDIRLEELEPGTEPRRGKTFSPADVANVVAYLETYVIGRGEPTAAECAEFYDNPAAAACRGLD